MAVLVTPGSFLKGNFKTYLEVTVRICSRRVHASLTAPLSSGHPDVEMASQPWFMRAQLLSVSMQSKSRMPRLTTSTRSTGW